MQSDGSSVAVVGPRLRRRRSRRISAAHILWSGLLRVLQRIAHYKQGDRVEFKIGFSVRDLMTDKSRAVRDQLDALVQGVQKAGSYPAKEEAAHALRAVVDAFRDLLPPDVLLKMSESLPVREAARLRRAAAVRLQKDSRKGRKAAKKAAAARREASGRMSPRPGQTSAR